LNSNCSVGPAFAKAWSNVSAQQAPSILQFETPANRMSAPDLAQAVASATHTATTRRPVPARVQNDDVSFASMLAETPSDDTGPVPGIDKPTSSAETSPTEPLDDKLQETEASTSTEAGQTDPVAAQPMLTAVVVPAPTVAVDPAIATAPTPATAPATPPLAETVETAPEGGVEASVEDGSSAEGTLSIPQEGSSTPARTRDLIQRETSGNAASAQAGSDPAGGAAAGSEDATKGQGQPSTSTTPADGGTATPRASVETPSVGGLAVSEPVETATLQPTGPATEARTADATASTPALSTLSHGAIHATAQIAAQIVKKLEGRSTRFEMALTPDDLGRVDVSLDIDVDGQLSARLAFDNPLAAADLRGRVDELRRQLTDAGFTVADDALSFDQREPSAGSNAFDRSNDRQSARAFGAASRLSLEADVGLVPPRWMSLTLAPERVDMKV